MPDPHPGPPIRGRVAIVSFGLAALTIALGAACLIPDACGSSHDDGIYVVTAKALAEGRGYRLIHLPGSPAQTKYPILYPALLAVVWKIWPNFPENLAAMHAVTLLTAGAAVGLAYAYLRRFDYFASPVAAGACLLCATSPTFLYYADRLLSEMPFALLLVLAFWMFERLLRSPRASRSRQFATGIVLAAPFLCRSIGITLIPAFFWIAWRRRLSLRFASLGMLATALPWVLWSVAHLGEARRNPVLGYYTDYLGWWAEVAPWEAGQFIALNAFFLVYSIPVAIFGLSGSFWQDRGTGVFLSILSGMTALTAFAFRLRRLECLPMCLLSYLTLVLVWPWPPLRFLVPIAPFLAAFFLSSVAAILGRLLPARVAKFGYWTLITLAIVGNLLSLARLNDLSRRSGYPLMSTRQERASSSDFHELFAWIRSRTDPGDVMAVGLDPTIYLYTGRTSFRPFVARPLALFYGRSEPMIGTTGELSRSLEVFRPRYLVQTPLVGFAEEEPFDRLIEELIERGPNRLEEVYTGQDRRFVIYRVRWR